MVFFVWLAGCFVDWLVATVGVQQDPDVAEAILVGAGLATHPHTRLPESWILNPLVLYPSETYFLTFHVTTNRVELFL